MPPRMKPCVCTNFYQLKAYPSLNFAPPPPRLHLETLIHGNSDAYDYEALVFLCRWAKNCDNAGYNANSGVAIIIGKATGKLLYLGVRNKYCSACAQGIPKHQCYKNWAVIFF